MKQGQLSHGKAARSVVISQTVAIVLLMVAALPARAVDCIDVYPGGAQTHNNGGELKFSSNSKIINNPDGTVATKKLTDDSSPSLSCDTVSCSKTNSSSATGDDAFSYPGGGDVTISSNPPAPLSPTNYKKLTVSSGVTLTLSGGDYTFKEDLILGDNVTLVIASGATVRLLVKKKHLVWQKCVDQYCRVSLRQPVANLWQGRYCDCRKQ